MDQSNLLVHIDAIHLDVCNLVAECPRDVGEQVVIEVDILEDLIDRRQVVINDM